MYPRTAALPLLMLVTAIASLSLAACATDDEPNGSFATASIIAPGSNAGTLAFGQDDDDYYQFVVAPGQEISVVFMSQTSNDYLYLTLYDSTETKAFEVKSRGNTEASDHFYTANETGTGTWYIHVWDDTEGASYTFLLSLSDPNDALQHRDAGADVGGALAITAGEEVAGHLEHLDTSDYYTFVAGSGDIIHVDYMSWSVESVFLVLYDADHDTILDLSSKADNLTSGEWCTANETLVGDWYVQVELDIGSSGYKFWVNVTHQDDGGSGDDAGADYATALYVHPGTLPGRLQQADGKDYFAFMAGSGDVISVDFNSQSSNDDLSLYLEDPDHNTLATLRSKQGVTASDVYWTSNETAMALFYLHVELGVSAGAYQVVLGVVPQDDAGLLDDAPEALADSRPILPGHHTGHLEDADEFDTFRFKAGEGDGIRVDFSSGAGNEFIKLEFVDQDEFVLWTLESLGNTVDAGAYLTANETAAVWWFIRVVMDTAPGDYAFDLVVERQDDAGSGMDAATAILHGLPLQNGVVDGQLGALDTADYYSLEVMGGWEVTVNLTNGQETSMSCGIIGDTGSQVPIGTVASAGGQMGTGRWTVPLTVTLGSHWYLKVVAATGFEPGHYTLELFVKETPPDQETPMLTFTDPAGAKDGQPLALTAVVTDNIAILDVWLHFKIDDDISWSGVQMNRSTGDNYTATVPGAMMDGQSFKFYIIARDTSFNDRSHGSQASPRQVAIEPADAVPPEVHYKPPSSVVKGKDLTISVEATDNVGVVSVMAYFKIDDEITWHELALTQSGNVYKGTIPSSDLQGSKFHYYIVAKDAAGGTGSYGTEASSKTLSIKPKDEGPGFAASTAAAAVLTIAAALAVTARGRRR